MVGAHVALCAAAPGELSAVLPVTDLVLHTMEQTMVLMATLALVKCGATTTIVGTSN
jgi:hypothetical protein